MSDSSFDDDDDLLLALVRATQAPPAQKESSSTTNGNLEIHQQLFRADGENAILRAQLESLKALKIEEVTRLHHELQAARNQAEGHISALKQSVDKLEDEKKFLGNEILSLSKRRKIGNAHLEQTDKLALAPKPRVPTKPLKSAIIRLQDEWSQFCDHLHHNTINGSSRTSMEFLAKICVEDPFRSGDLQVPAKMPLSSAIWDYLMLKKDLRLDDLVFLFCEQVIGLTKQMLLPPNQTGPLVPVPFLLSLVHASINFKNSAVSENLVTFLVNEVGLILDRFVFLLDLADEEEESFLDHHSVTYQQRVLENFTLILCFDLLENVVIISTQFGPHFVAQLWKQMKISLLTRVLPENTERFKSAAQINLVYNFVEMLSASLTDQGLAIENSKLHPPLVKSLIKVFLIDISIKEDFMFFGLNRMLGNNRDLEKIGQMVPADPTKVLNQALVSVAYPVECKKLSENDVFQISLNHECHLLSLRLRIATLLESLIVSTTPSCMHLLNLKENIKSIVRIIGFEQNFIIHLPRSKYIHMRLGIIAVLVRILYYITEENRNIDTLIYPETLHEIFVVLMRIAFGSDSLSFEAHKLLSEIRAKGITDIGVFNKCCEHRSREMAHISLHDSRPDKFQELSNIECDFPNGLEFPYELETVEIAREILGVCVNHDEADNLYYNMNCEDAPG